MLWPSPNGRRRFHSRWRMPHLWMTAIIGRKVRPLRVSLYAPSVLSFKLGRMLIKRDGVVIGTEPTLATMLRSRFTRRYKLVIGTQTPDVLTKLAEPTATGDLQPKTGGVVSLSEAILAVADLELKGKPYGKLVLVTS